ncbi:MAG: tetratricopeptide repeat protein, partial [Phycisphaerae bacterium]|nr:tetratricopeptide repeat protein [Phycisphaerae bacterium]
DGRLDQAISDFTKAIELKDEYAEAHFNRGSTYRMKGDFDTAIGDLTRAIELNPKLAMAYSERALVYFNKRNFDRARGDVRAAQALGYEVPHGFLEALRKASAEN